MKTKLIITTILALRWFREILPKSKPSVAMAVSGLACTAMGASPPNIVFILADDLGWMDTGVYQRDFSEDGLTYYETPHLDRLASEGMRFTQAYVSPMCSPTRAMLLTGMHNAHTGVIKAGVNVPHDDNFDEIIDPQGWHGNPQFAVFPASNRLLLDGSHVTFAERLREVGYLPGYLGKWHVGFHNKVPSATPEAQGFEVLGYFDKGGSSYLNWYPDWEHYGKPMDADPNSYMTVAESQVASRFIEENRNRRFLLYYSSGAVHSPFQDDPASGYRKHFENKGREGWLDDSVEPFPVYAAMIKSLDDAVGAIMQTLEETRGPDGRPLAENTLVIFISDNGGINRFQFFPREHPLRDKVITSNYPLRGAKGNVYEGGIRVPFIARWPEQVAAGQVCDVMVTGQDLYTLLLEAGGLETAPGSASLMSLLRDPQDAAGYGRDTIYFHFPFWWPSTVPNPVIDHDPPMSAIRQGDYKLIYYHHNQRAQLYNIADDIGESRDLSKTLPERTEILKATLIEWMEKLEPQYNSRPNPRYQPTSGSPYSQYPAP